MNPTRLRKLADVIEQAEADTFDMSSWFTTVDTDIVRADALQGGGISHGCGTAGCIAGWACSTFLPPGAHARDGDISTQAAELLGAVGAERWDMQEMFTSSSYWQDRGRIGEWESLEDVTQTAAAAELRDLADRAETMLTHIKARGPKNMGTVKVDLVKPEE